MTKTDVIKTYTYRVTWSEKDQAYVGLCAEFPDLRWPDRSQEHALRGIVKVVRDTVRGLQKARKAIPEPLAFHRYSGQFRVRVPPEVHRRLSIEAAEANVSMNRLVSAKLARG